MKIKEKSKSLRCGALTAEGTQCTFKAIVGIYCILHFQKIKKTRKINKIMNERLKDA